MNEREFKLLVREYFKAKSKANYSAQNGWTDLEIVVTLEKRILSELEAFTEKEQTELPFKD